MQSRARSAMSDVNAGEAGVRAQYQRLMDGWNAGDAEAFAAAFAADGDLVGFDGTHLQGRREIAEFHQPLFDQLLKGTRLVGEVTGVKFLASDLALLHAVGGTIMRGKQRPAPERDSMQTLVLERRAEGWRIAAFQNTRIRPMGKSAGGTLLWLLFDALWRFFGTKRQEPDR